MTTGINTEAHQNQRPQQREDGLLAGYHHYAGEAQLAKGVQRNEAAQILHDLNRRAKVIGRTSDVQKGNGAWLR